MAGFSSVPILSSSTAIIAGSDVITLNRAALGTGTVKLQATGFNLALGSDVTNWDNTRDTSVKEGWVLTGLSAGALSADTATWTGVKYLESWAVSGISVYHYKRVAQALELPVYLTAEP